MEERLEDQQHPQLASSIFGHEQRDDFAEPTSAERENEELIGRLRAAGAPDSQ